MSHVFISYAREDYPRAQKLAMALERSRVPIWWDPQIRLGDQFPPAIENALKAASAVVVLWSRASVRSAWVIKEATIGVGRGVLLPVLLNRVQPPAGFAQLDCADLSDWDPRKPHREFDQLRRALLPLFGPVRGTWQTDRLDKETLLVRLDLEQHTVRYWRGDLYVDGELRVPGVPSVIDQRTFRFELSDGGRRYPAQLDVWVTLFRGNVKGLTFEVGGTVLYKG